MIEPTPALLHEAYLRWKFSHYVWRDIDSELETAERRYRLQTGWLKNAREALQLSANKAAARLGTSPQSYLEIERSELRGSASVKKIARAAEALGCELVYFIRPKSRRLFSEVVWEQLLTEINGKFRVAHNEGQFACTVAAQAYDLMNKGKFRRKRGWSIRTSRGR
jgi:transcriptional regulator with XRE-family HTH domain